MRRPYNRCPICNKESLYQPCYDCHGKAEFKRGWRAGINKFAEKWRYLTTVSDRYWALGGQACFEEIMEKLRKTG